MPAGAVLIAFLVVGFFLLPTGIFYALLWIMFLKFCRAELGLNGFLFSAGSIVGALAIVFLFAPRHYGI